MQRAPLICVLALAFALGGCGGGEDEQRYADEVNAAQTRLTRAFAELQTRISNVSEPERDAVVLGEYATAVDKALSDLRAIDPPDDVRELHSDLVAQTASYKPVIAAARDALGSDDARAVVKAQVDLTTGVTRITAKINETSSAINRAMRK